MYGRNGQGYGRNCEILARELGQQAEYVKNVVQLLDEGNTIPFIARYRKEMTGSLDDQILRELSERLAYLRNLDEQREKVRASIEEQGKLTDELSAALNAAVTLTEVEDLYRPYRPKRKNPRLHCPGEGPAGAGRCGAVAQGRRSPAPADDGGGVCVGGKGVASPEDALQGRAGHPGRADVGRRGNPPAAGGLYGKRRDRPPRRQRGPRGL